MVEEVIVPSARELGTIDFRQDIENVEKALACEFVNPMKRMLSEAKQEEFKELLRESHRKIDLSDAERIKAMWTSFHAKSANAIPLSSREKFSTVERRLREENPPGAMVFSTQDGNGNPAYVILNWGGGGSAEFDAARLRNGETKLGVIQELKAFLSGP